MQNPRRPRRALGSGICLCPACAFHAGQQCLASLVVAQDHHDSEHDHYSGDDLRDKTEATPLLVPALTVGH